MALVYVDTSVAIAHLFTEDRRPPASLWSHTLVASKLVEYELWTRIHARAAEQSHGDAARSMIARFAVLALSPPVLARALEPFPISVRTPDALHLASIDFLRTRGHIVALASYDRRMLDGATAIGIPHHEL
jgi:predicted nucleic acid-binding protein